MSKSIVNLSCINYSYNTKTFNSVNKRTIKIKINVHLLNIALLFLKKSYATLLVLINSLLSVLNTNELFKQLTDRF